MEIQTFKAIMGRPILITTVVVYAFLLGLCVYFGWELSRRGVKGMASYGIMYGLFLCVALGAFFPFLSIRGYKIDSDFVRVQLPFREKRFALDDLVSVRTAPDALDGAYREMANGGLFSYLGRYRSPELGVLKVFVSDARRMALLDFGEERVVMSPDDPDRFVRILERRANKAQ